MIDIKIKDEYLSDWRSELIESSECLCEGCGQNPCTECGEDCHGINEGAISKLVKIGIGGFLASKGLEAAKKSVNNKLDDARKNMKIGGDKRKSDIEKATGVKLEHIEGGISVQNVADGLNFTEIETVDIIKPEPIKGSSDIEESAAGKIVKQVFKSPGVKRFVSNLSRKTKVKIVSSNPVITPGSTLGSGGKFAANQFPKVSSQAGSSYIPKHVLRGNIPGGAGDLKDYEIGRKLTDKVKVYKQPPYAQLDKYPGDKTGAYARELARQDNTARIGKNSAINKDGTSNRGHYNPDGRNTVGGKVRLKPARGLEDKTLEFLKKMKNESYNNWKLEMVTEMLISEGYNDEEIIGIFEEPQILMELDRELTAAGVFLSKYGPKMVQGAKSAIPKAAKFAKGVFNRGVRDTKLTKDIIDVSKKLRKPDGISVTKPKIDTPDVGKGGGLVKSFKGFMDKIKTRTGAKIERIKAKDLAKKAETQSMAKDVDVLGGAATSKATKPMKNITPTPIGDGIKKVANKAKLGAGVVGGTTGAVVGSKLIGGSSSKVVPAAPITNDGKKTVDPSKNEKINTSRGKTVDRVFGAQIAQTRKLKGDAAADKQRKKFMSRPVTSLEMEEGAYRGGGTIINPSGSRNKFGLPDSMKPGPGPTKEVPLTPSQNRLLVKKKEKPTTVATTVASSYSWRDELGLTERKLTKKEEKKKEDIVMGMKDDKKGFKKRYGDDAESVMYATATKIAKGNK